MYSRIRLFGYGMVQGKFLTYGSLAGCVGSQSAQAQPRRRATCGGLFAIAQTNNTGPHSNSPRAYFFLINSILERLLSRKKSYEKTDNFYTELVSRENSSPLDGIVGTLCFLKLSDVSGKDNRNGKFLFHIIDLRSAVLFPRRTKPIIPHLSLVVMSCIYIIVYSRNTNISHENRARSCPRETYNRFTRSIKMSSQGTRYVSLSLSASPGRVFPNSFVNSRKFSFAHHVRCIQRVQFLIYFFSPFPPFTAEMNLDECYVRVA